MGGKTAPVGRIAGRDTARKLPLELADATLESVVAALGERMQAGFEFSLDGDQVLIRVWIPDQSASGMTTCESV